MRWADKCSEWSNSEVTQAVRQDIVKSLQELAYSMVYEEDSRKITIMQGMQRAYYDLLDIMDNLEDLKEPNGESDD